VAFISFEGIEGSGKSTQLQRLARALGPAVVVTREPGGTPLGQAIRKLLLEGETPAPLAEVLLFFADRAEHVATVVRPGLEKGLTVLTDRYSDSTLAYQGYGRGLSVEILRALSDTATGGLWPDLTLLLDLDVETGLARAGRRGTTDRLEGEDTAFHDRVRSGYLDLARQEPRRFAIVDGRGTADVVERLVWNAVSDRGLLVGDRRGA
jgi:dTMP kinase